MELWRPDTLTVKSLTAQVLSSSCLETGSRSRVGKDRRSLQGQEIIINRMVRCHMCLGPALIKTTHRSRENVTETIEAQAKPVHFISLAPRRLRHPSYVKVKRSRGPGVIEPIGVPDRQTDWQ